MLGGATLEGDVTRALERKTAALLTYLALEGPTARSKLAGLLWPEREEKTARNNLVQVLRRLRALCGEDLVTGSDPLALDPELEVDAAGLKVAMFQGEHAAVLACRGELLAGHDYDDLPDLSDWLYSERERLAELRRQARFAEIARLEAEGAYGAALEHVQALIEQDPVAEEAHRLTMRLHYLAGDRAAALRAFKRCEDVLRRELGVGPLPETLELMRALERGRVPVATVQTRPAIPLSVLRPPVLVGRESEWGELQAAWGEGQLIAVSGPPGSGKTRLLTDFVADKGRVLKSEGRPGDAAVPFLSLTRSFRRFFALVPELELEPWLREELARLLPDLFEEAAATRSPDDPLRFHEAMYQLARLTADHVQAVVLDDYQFYDPSSFDTGARATSRLIAEGLGPTQARTLVTFRSGEMPAAFHAALNQLVEQDLAVHIELEPLSPEATTAMLSSLELAELPAEAAGGLAQGLHRYTGGNPLFIVETVKALVETRQLGESLPARLPPSGRVRALLHERLGRLSPAATHLAWAAAVAQEDFSLELASAALEQGVFALAEPWQELERAQVFAGGRFSHDLLFEASLASVPAPIKALLHRRCASQLQTRGGNPARVAKHYQEAGDELRAAPLLLEAANRARDGFQLTEAADFLERAAAIFEAAGARQEAFSALDGLTKLLIQFDVGERSKSALARLLDLADRPEQQAWAWHRQAVHLGKLGQGEETEKAARNGLRYVEATTEPDPQLKSELLNELGAALWLQDRLSEAFTVLEEALVLSESLGRPADIAICLTNLGVMLDHLERHEEAAHHHRRAAAMFEALGDKMAWVSTLSNLSISKAEQGLVQASLDTLTVSLALTEGVSGSESNQLYNLGLLGACQTDLACYAVALQTFERAEAVAQSYDQYAAGVIRRHQARALTELGRFREAGALLDLAQKQPNLPGHQLARVWLTRAVLLQQQGLDPADALRDARRLIEGGSRKLLFCWLWLSEALLLPPAQGRDLAQRALELVLLSELKGLRIAAETRCAQMALALGEAEAAGRHSRATGQLLEHYHPSDFYLGEVLFTRYRALKACGDPGAPGQLEACLAWVMNVADHHCPPEYRESFLTRNPVNRAILEAARAQGLER